MSSTLSCIVVKLDTRKSESVWTSYGMVEPNQNTATYNTATRTLARCKWLTTRLVFSQISVIVFARCSLKSIHMAVANITLTDTARKRPSSSATPTRKGTTESATSLIITRSSPQSGSKGLDKARQIVKWRSIYAELTLIRRNTTTSSESAIRASQGSARP